MRPPCTRPRLPLPSIAPLQWLNIGIFQAIGHAGVYYGFKLGHTIPWVDGFPFNVVRWLCGCVCLVCATAAAFEGHTVPEVNGLSFNVVRWLDGCAAVQLG